MESRATGTDAPPGTIRFTKADLQSNDFPNARENRSVHASWLFAASTRVGETRASATDHDSESRPQQSGLGATAPSASTRKIRAGETAPRASLSFIGANSEGNPSDTSQYRETPDTKTSKESSAKESGESRERREISHRETTRREAEGDISARENSDTQGQQRSVV